MEVTRENFQDVLSSLSEVFQKAQFIAFDTEFTGLRVEGAHGLNYFDTLEDLYLKDRLRAETFMAIQIGLVAFIYDDSTNKYSHLGYNFYVYPSKYSNINFTCQSSSVQFLIEHGFDFNKLFKEGIPYLKEEEVDKHLEKLKEKYEKNYHPENVTKVEIPNEHKETVNKIVTKIEGALNLNEKVGFMTERHNSYVRRLIYNTVQSTFGSKVLLESNSDGTMTVYVGFTKQEIKEKQKEKFLDQEKEILNEIGFSKVIKLLIESQKLLIGHNLFLDILFIIRQFLVSLPNTYSEFKELIKFLFPKIIDTKYLAGAEMKEIKDTSLNYLVEYFDKSKALPEVEINQIGAGYKLQDNKIHEASYDAYLTGLCFLGMAEYLGKLNCASNIFKNLPESPILKPALNKLSTPKLSDIFFMNLGGLDNEPDRTGVYHLTFQKEWTKENITDLFKNCGFINISWINDTSAYIKVKKEFINEVEKNLLIPNENYRLLSHSKYKSLCNSSAEYSLYSPKEKRLGNDLKNVQHGSSPKNTSDNNVGVKRKIEEDIGEVFPRQRVKRMS